MCGIYGMVGVRTPVVRCPQLLEQMGSALRHRGPDGSGALVTPPVAFGATRLRIVDPTPAGDQPFLDPVSQVLLVCNGEIYNAPALRRRYSSYRYRSESDVETIIPLYRDKGVAGFADLRGMFALALYDFRKRQLVLARDPAGEKPLFHARYGGEVWFASEVQALLQPGGPRRTIDRAAALDLLSLGYVREPRTMFSTIRKVEAGTALVFSDGHATKIVYHGSDRLPDGDASGRNVDSLAAIVRAAVQVQATTSGSLGIFASGGVDSSLISTHAVRAIGRDRVHLFTAGFSDPSYDESASAANLARHLGTEHTVVRTDDRSLTEALYTIVERVAEPITDPAILPTYLLAGAASRDVRVVLSGEGADELFGGYPTYLGHRWSASYSRLPRAVRRSVAGAVAKLPATDRKVSLEFLLKQFVAHAGLSFPTRHLAWFGTGVPLRTTRDDVTHTAERWGLSETGDPVQSASEFDYRTYLRDNLLVKVDRATMLCSLEARAPFLDPGVVRFAQTLDPALKVRGLTTKWALKRAAERDVPRRIVRQTKRGLSVPVGRWLKTTLREDVDRLLSRERLDACGLFSVDAVCQLLSEHRSGAANHARPLWALLMYGYWLERWGSEDGS